MSKKRRKNRDHRQGASSTSRPAAPQNADSSALIALPFKAWRLIASAPVAWGIAILILIRPMKDGLTYPPFNTYFLWGIVLLFSCWAIGQLMRGEPFLHGKLISCFAVFLAICLLTSFNTVEVDTTDRKLLVWASHFLLFVLLINALRTPRARIIVLMALIVAGLYESVWSIVHLHYVLPYVRQFVQSGSSVAEVVLGESHAAPEMTYRLNTNRAFGDFIAPNALAAFLLAIAPTAIGGAFYGWGKLRDAMAARDTEATPSDYPLYAFCVGIVGGLGMGAIAYTLYPLFYVMQHMREDWLQLSLPVVFFFGLLPLVTGGIPAVIMLRHGPSVCGRAVQTILCAFTALASLYALWLTYSRGAFVAIVAASCAAMLLLIIANRMSRKTSRMDAAAVLLFAAGLALWGTTPNGVAQDAVPPPAESAAAATPAEPAFHEELNVEGKDLSAADMANLSSFRMRLTYWKVGLIMAKDNFWTGVGLGNFGVAYPKYQYVGAYDVKAAHNDYIQMWCETGFFGLLAFVSFWGLFLAHGLREILAQQSTMRRWLLLGLYTSTLAFLLHAVVDFNFHNPGLAFFPFVTAGLFCAHTARTPSTPTKPLPSQIVTILLLLVVALSAGRGVRIFSADYAIAGRNLWNIGSDQLMKSRFAMAQFLLTEVPETTKPGEQPPYRTYDVVSTFVTDEEALAKFAAIRVRDETSPGQWRALREGEPTPPEALVFIVDPAQAKAAALTYARAWLDDLETADRIYPHNTELAFHLHNWYLVLQQAAPNETERRKYILACEQWAAAAVARSPMQAQLRQAYGTALWLRGNIESGKTANEYFDKGLEQYRMATVNYPNGTYTWQGYGEKLKTLGEAYLGAGDTKKGRPLVETGEQVLAKAQTLSAQWTTER